MSTDESGNNIEMQVEAVNELTVLWLTCSVIQGLLYCTEWKRRKSHSEQIVSYFVAEQPHSKALRGVLEASRFRVLARVRRLELVFFVAASTSEALKAGTFQTRLVVAQEKKQAKSFCNGGHKGRTLHVE